ncbi:hypothetical protein D7V86_26000 [bacterium D16-51]|nr:hypothetical protein D7V96_26135 [bacterium D16-59]RKI52283.1 hypothetical protein D7V86_26000 [bacterium D16-51]
MNKLQEIYVPFLGSTAIAIVLYLVSSKKIGVVLCVIIIVIVLLLMFVMQKIKDNSTVYLNDYIKVQHKNMKYIDYSNKTKSCDVLFYYGDNKQDHIRIYTYAISIDTYREIKGDYQYYLGYVNGHCAGNFNSVYGIEPNQDNVHMTDSKGIVIDNMIINYSNTSVCEKEFSGKYYLVINKVLVIRFGEVLVAELYIKDVDYKFYLNSRSENIMAFRRCFENIQQRMVKMKEN